MKTSPHFEIKQPKSTIEESEFNKTYGDALVSRVELD